MPDKQSSAPGMSRGLKTLLIALGAIFLVLGLTYAEIVIKSHQERPLLGNVFALAILNINVLLLIFIVLLLGRQFVKIYFEKKKSPFGAGFRTKLVTALIALSIGPATLLVIVAAGLLTGGVKYWFGPRVESAVRDSIAIVRSYREDLGGSAQHFSEEIAQRLQMSEPGQYGAIADASLSKFDLDLVEIYGRDGKPLAVAGNRKLAWAGSDKNFIEKALKERRLTSSDELEQGDVVRGATVFLGGNGSPAGVVIADNILPAEMSRGSGNIEGFYNEYWGLRTFKNPIKESYILSFTLIALVILFAALWFGLYLSKTITVPIISLAEATDRISKGDYNFQINIRATDEIGVLVDSFKRMTQDLKTSQEKLNEANISLMRSNDLLEQRRQFMETVLENVNTGVITMDRAGKISTVNRAAVRIMEVPAATLLGRSYREVFETQQLEEIREQVREMAESGGQGLERNIQITVNGRLLTLRLFVSPLHETGGGYLGTLIVFDDLSELIRAQRAAAWKEVARRIAHEVKNPLTPIQLSAQRLRKRFLEGAVDCGPLIGECTETIIKQVEGMKALVDEFSKFARMPEADPRPNDLHRIIDDVVMLYSGAHRDIAIEREYDPALPVINVDAEQMKRVFLNLFDNAVAAMDGGGRIWVRTGLDGQLGMAKVEVADEGTGIAPEDREKLFLPYFSKKKSGTGLGLAIVNRIVADHGGYIRVEDNSPKGARFVIELPVKA